MAVPQQRNEKKHKGRQRANQSYGGGVPLQESGVERGHSPIASENIRSSPDRIFPLLRDSPGDIEVESDYEDFGNDIESLYDSDWY